MEQKRIKSTVEDPSWGRAIVFTYDPESKVQLKTSISVEASKMKLKTTLSEVRKEFDIEDELVDQETKVNVNLLPYLGSALFATILKDSITELRILEQCNTALKITQTMSSISQLLALKFGVKQSKSQYELDGFDLKNLGSDSNKIRKLDEDRKYTADLLASMYTDLILSGSFEILSHHIDAIKDLEIYRLDLEEDESKNRLLRRDLYKQLRQQRNHIKSALYDCDCTIDVLKTQVEDSTIYSAIKSRYVDNWQVARTEQNTQTIHDNEAKPANSIEYYKMRNDHEQRVHSEMELLGNIIINETIEKVDSWMNKYDKDIEDIDFKIQMQKNNYQNMRDKRIDYENTIEKHDLLMKEWIHFKEEREKARRYHELMTKSALTVQAWWRGLLVRRQLGPYRVTKKKGDTKK